MPNLQPVAPASPPSAPLMLPIGRHLVDDGKITATQLVQALDRQKRIAAPLGEILRVEGLVSDRDVICAVARQRALDWVDLNACPPDPVLARMAPRSLWVRHRCVPWQRKGNVVQIACAHPDDLEALHRELPDTFDAITPILAPRVEIMSAIARIFRREMTAFAEARVSPEMSCRHWRPLRPRALALALAAAAGLVWSFLTWPAAAFSMLCAVAVICLFGITGLKIAGGLAQVGHRIHADPPRTDPPKDRLPMISVIVPLFKETEIAEALIARLKRLTYPRVLLDVILVLEEKDHLTRATLSDCDLPGWMRVVEVPDGGGVTTKPRALNYALDFCRGEIIGIWDAEDAPAPDQLEQVAFHFARAAPDVACLQGVLDYYNPRRNWLSRCFTIEYASWFRVVLPGLARLGLVIPLGGTTLFLRRDRIFEMGGWDAHNVTEDADLGVRIARMGYRTEFIATPTYEEANCRPWRWVRQRSRWLKGFMVTYAVHMRHPARLIAQIGWRRFLGLQGFFVGTLSQFLFAPVLWSFWLLLFGLPHPVQGYLPWPILVGIVSLFLLTELVNLTIALFAVSRPEHRWLMPWALTMPFYYPLGVLAAYKAFSELLIKPFYWDKTQHGLSHPEGQSPVPA